MDVTLLTWLVTLAVTVGFFVWEFLAHVRTPHEPTIAESARWSAFYVGLAVLFGVGVGVVSGWRYGGEFLAGYLTEKALSVDNLFVFLLIMGAFAVPRRYQQKVLMIGIVIALVMRGLFIAAGAALIEEFSWVFYVFGAVLFVLAIRQLRGGHGDGPGENLATRLARRVLPTTDEYHGDRLTARVGGRRLVTPMLLVVVALGFTDVVFALDSIPAIYGLTEEPWLVFTANAFALMGLRQLYFLIGGLLVRLVYLAQGLAVILAFIGVKLVLHALHVNELPFVNGGRPLTQVPEVPIWLSLVVILGVVAVATVASLVRSRRMPERTEPEHAEPEHADTERTEPDERGRAEA